MKELQAIGDLFNTFNKDMDFLIAKSKVNVLFCKKYELEVKDESTNDVIIEISNKIREFGLLEDLEFNIIDGEPNLVNASFMGDDLDEDILLAISEDSSWCSQYYWDNYSGNGYSA